eukprot:234985_1
MQRTCLDVQYVVAIDFGSSGLCASYCPPNTPRYNNIVQNLLPHGGKKELASLLIDKKTQETIAIGYEAEEQYAKSMEQKQDKQFMYFERLKQSLYNEDGLTVHQEIQSGDCKSALPLSDVITKLFQSVILHSLEYINQKKRLVSDLEDITKDRVYWVLSAPGMPACYKFQSHTDFLLQCAHKAGIKHCGVVSEPICTLFRAMDTEDDRINKEDRQFIVLDCGGRTTESSYVDLSDLTADGQNKNEKESESDSDSDSEFGFSDTIFCGGNAVDDKFISLFKTLFPQECLDIINDRPTEWIRLKREFSDAKSSVPLELDDWWNVDLPFCIKQWIGKKRRKKKTDPTFKNLQKGFKAFAIPNVANPDNVEMISDVFALGRSGYLKIKKEGWLWLHEPALHAIVSFLKGTWLHDIQKVILSGGFANSQYLIDRLKKEFPHRTFVVPPSPHLAVVRGALYAAHQTSNHCKCEEIHAYVREIEDLKEQIRTLKKENDGFKKRGYIRNEVVERKVRDKSEITIRENVKQKQTDIDDGMGVHVNRLTEWNDFSNRLQNQFENRNDN